MKRNIQFCFIVLIPIIIWSCCPDAPESVMVVSIPEIGVQGLLQNSHSGLKADSILLDELKRVRQFELALQTMLTGDKPQQQYLMKQACCPCDSTSRSVLYGGASYGDICCPCPSTSSKFDGGVSLISHKAWDTKVGLRLTEREELNILKSKEIDEFQLFSLEGITDGDYRLTIEGKFALASITLNVKIKEGRLMYKP